MVVAQYKARGRYLFTSAAQVASTGPQAFYDRQTVQRHLSSSREIHAGGCPLEKGKFEMKPEKRKFDMKLTAQERPTQKQPIPMDLHDQVRRCAYQIYEERGKIDGYEVEDWLRAEAELLGARRPGRAA